MCQSWPYFHRPYRREIKISWWFAAPPFSFSLFLQWVVVEKEDTMAWKCLSQNSTEKHTLNSYPARYQEFSGDPVHSGQCNIQTHKKRGKKTKTVQAQKQKFHTYFNLCLVILSTSAKSYMLAHKQGSGTVWLWMVFVAKLQGSKAVVPFQR